jgi:hypothetical protein
MNSTHSTPKKGPAPKFAVWSKFFLADLRLSGNVTHAAEVAGIDRGTAYKRRDKNKTFRHKWDEAMLEARERLEIEARRRAEQGVERLKFHKGELIMVPVFDEEDRPIMVPILDDEGEPSEREDGRPRVMPLMAPYREHEYSDTLLIFLIKHNWPEKYREQYELMGKGGAPLLPPAEQKYKDLTDEELHERLAELDAKRAGRIPGAE